MYLFICLFVWVGAILELTDWEKFIIQNKTI